MSIRAHQHKELTTKDDLQSWFYMLVELTKGFLPWTSMTGTNILIKKNKKFRYECHMLLQV